MASFFKAAFSALPTVATHPLALVGYLALVLAWGLIAWKVKRNQNLLASLEKLPDADRLKALELEMGSVRVPEGLTPEQWLASRTQYYKFLGFGILCLLIVAIFIIAALTKEPKGKVAMSTTLLPDNIGKQAATDHPIRVDVSVAENKDPTAGDSQPIAPESAVSPGIEEAVLHYIYDRTKDGIAIKPVMPYLTRLAAGGPVRGISMESWFSWNFPKISVKTVNNTKQTLLLSEAAVTVRASVLNTEPVLVMDEQIEDELPLYNVGWGPANNLSIHYGLAPLPRTILQEKEDILQFVGGATPYTASIASIPAGSMQSVAIREAIQQTVPPSASEGSRVPLCMFGSIAYVNQSQQARTLAFKIEANRGGGADLEPCARVYDLKLEAYSGPICQDKFSPCLRWSAYRSFSL